MVIVVVVVAVVGADVVVNIVVVGADVVVVGGGVGGGVGVGVGVGADVGVVVKVFNGSSITVRHTVPHWSMVLPLRAGRSRGN